MLALKIAAVMAVLGFIILAMGLRETRRPGPGDMRAGGAGLAAVGAILMVIAFWVALIATLVKVWT